MVTPTAMIDANSNAAPNNVRCPRLCRRRRTDAGCGKSPLDEMEKGLEQNEPDEEIERQEESGRNGKVLRDSAMQLRDQQNEKERTLR